MNLKLSLLGFLLTGSALLGQDSNAFTTASGPNAPQVGDTVPETMGFAMSPTPAENFVNSGNDNSFVLPNLENRLYSDFPNEVVVTVYHTPW